MIEEFKALVNQLTNEYNERGGLITCEFSTDINFSIAKSKFLSKASKRVNGSEWRMFECNTCKGHHHRKPIHVEIK